MELHDMAPTQPCVELPGNTIWEQTPGQDAQGKKGQEKSPEHSSYLAETCSESRPTHSQPEMACQRKKRSRSICWKCCCFHDMQKDIFFDIFSSFLRLRNQPAICCDFSQTFSGQIFHFLLTLLSDLQHPRWMCLFDISKIYLLQHSLYFQLAPPQPRHRQCRLPFPGCSTYSPICFSCCYCEY